MHSAKVKQTIYILTFALGLWNCNNRTADNSDGKSTDTLSRDSQPDTESASILQEQQSTINNKQIETSKDSVVFFSDSLFVNLELKLKEISKNIFQSYKKGYKPICSLDSNGFIKGKGLILSHYCKDVCEAYLIDKKEGIKLVLPSSYDAGVVGLLVSPSCNQFIIYSSYDLPDYKKYYEYRAEIFGFTLTQEQGIKAIKPSFKYYTTSWSIEDMTWLNDNTLALKLYKEGRFGNGENLKFSYFNATLK